MPDTQGHWKFHVHSVMRETKPFVFFQESLNGFEPFDRVVTWLYDEAQSPGCVWDGVICFTKKNQINIRIFSSCRDTLESVEYGLFMPGWNIRLNQKLSKGYLIYIVASACYHKSLS